MSKNILIITCLLIILSTITVSAESISQTEYEYTGQLSCTNAESPLEIRVPDSLITDSTDRFQSIHPGTLYAPNGLYGYKYWLTTNPYINGAATDENVCLYASHDGINWLPPTIDTSGFGDSATVINPIITNYQLVTGHLSDGHLVLGQDGHLRIIFRASLASENNKANVIYSMRTDNGFDWSTPVIILNGYFETLSEENSLDLLSPSVTLNDDGIFTMFVVNDSTLEGPARYGVSKYQSNDIDAPMSMNYADGYDTLFFGSVNVVFKIASFVNYKLPSFTPWHMSHIVRSDGVWVSLMNPTSHDRLFLSFSNNEGLDWSTIPEPILKKSNNFADWDGKTIYRASGFFVEDTEESVMQIYYSGKTDSFVVAGPVVWGTGLTHLFLYDTDPQNCCLGIRGNIDFDLWNQIDISDLIFFVDYQFNDGEPPLCFNESDYNNDGSVDIADLVKLVEFQFNDGLAPPSCPN